MPFLEIDKILIHTSKFEISLFPNSLFFKEIY